MNLTDVASFGLGVALGYYVARHFLVTGGKAA